MTDLLINVFVGVLTPLIVMAVIGLIWLYYSFRNHLKDFEEYKEEQDEKLEDKLKIERLTTEKQALELKADYTEKYNSSFTTNLKTTTQMESYMKRSVEVDEEQTKSINELRKLIIEKLLNGSKEK